MRRPLLCVYVLSTLMCSAIGLQAQPTLDTPCPTLETLQYYLDNFGANGGGCSVGVQNFSAFLFNSSGSATLATPSQIDVSPAIGGFQFSGIDGAFSVLDNLTALYQIDYFFNIDPAPIGTNASVDMDPIFGKVTIDQLYCADSYLTYPPPSNLATGGPYCQIPDPNTFTPQDLHLTYDNAIPVASLTTGLVPLIPQVMNYATTELDISLDGTGFVLGSGFDSVTGDTFLTDPNAPEPGTWLLLTSGLLVILARRRIFRVLS